jgi:hypothetical protein
MRETQNSAHLLAGLLFDWLRANQNISFLMAKTQHFDKWRPIYVNATQLTLFDHLPCYCVHTSSIISLNFENSFLFHISSKNPDFFSIMFKIESSIWLWILIFFSLAGFLIIIAFPTCVHKWYPWPFQLWNNDVASFAFEIFCGETRHIDLHFDIKFVDFPFVVCWIWIFEVMCYIWCHNMNMYFPNFVWHASLHPNDPIFCMSHPLYV